LALLNWEEALIEGCLECPLSRLLGETFLAVGIGDEPWNVTTKKAPLIRHCNILPF
jgi:hypothetical protein